MSVRRAGVRAGIALLLAAGLGLVGCAEEPVTVTKADFSAERKKLQETMAKKKEEKAKAGTTTKVAAKAAPAPEEATDFGSYNTGFEYDPTGRRDPFRSFEWERPDRLVDDESRGPLEKFDLAQLDIVAVVWETQNAKALVMDPSGRSYIVGEGARVGKNSGFVTEISDSSVVVKETYVDHLGQKSTKDIEMRMRGNEGG